jgi:hypothetical protein
MELAVEYKTVVWQKAIFNCSEEQKEEILEKIQNEDFSFLQDEKLGFVETQVLFDTEDIYEDINGMTRVDVKQDGVEIYRTY